jgi:5'-3' exonuclease
VFCFDSSSSLRSQVYEPYKKARKKQRDEYEDEERKLMRMQMYEQISTLFSMAPAMGIENAFRCDGYEADDLIAAVVKAIPEQVRKVYIVSSDEDLWQLLETTRVVCYRPTTKTYYKEADLFRDYGILPAQWASAKAWAGCSSDNIEGLPKVGLKTAAKFLSGKHKNPKTFTDHLEVYNRNILLTRLPYEGTPKLSLIPQDTPIQWNVLADHIGADSIPRGMR